MAEWLKAPVLKIGSEKHSRVRISTPPKDFINHYVQQIFYKLIGIAELILLVLESYVKHMICLLQLLFSI